MGRFREYAPAVAAVISVIFGAVAWHVAYVRPHEQFLHEVMGCMAERGDGSEAGYAACADEVSKRPR